MKLRKTVQFTVASEKKTQNAYEQIFKKKCKTCTLKTKKHLWP